MADLSMIGWLGAAGAAVWLMCVVWKMRTLAQDYALKATDLPAYESRMRWRNLVEAVEQGIFWALIVTLAGGSGWGDLRQILWPVAVTIGALALGGAVLLILLIATGKIERKASSLRAYATWGTAAIAAGTVTLVFWTIPTILGLPPIAGAAVVFIIAAAVQLMFNEAVLRREMRLASNVANGTSA